ncbi:uncharacterized protein [Littorina saxatilis]|uniref:CHHC U11-48K-type domain-containing protein n=1 Tax=Littorina saxatilis TaxID=31220 RepID=A0AAN9ARL2_9CAEN
MELAKEFVINDPEDLLECPYESSHMVRAKRMAYHIAKCRVHHVCTEMSRCPYNASHEVYTVELRYHMAVCEDKQRVQGKIAQERMEGEGEVKGCIETPGYRPLNIWGDSWEDDTPVESLFTRGRVELKQQPKREVEQPQKEQGERMLISDAEKIGLTGRQLQKLYLKRQQDQDKEQAAHRKPAVEEKLRVPSQPSQSLAIHHQQQHRQQQDIYQQALKGQQDRALALGRGRGLLLGPNPVHTVGAGRGLVGSNPAQPQNVGALSVTVNGSVGVSGHRQHPSANTPAGHGLGDTNLTSPSVGVIGSRPTGPAGRGMGNVTVPMLGGGRQNVGVIGDMRSAARPPAAVQAKRGGQDPQGKGMASQMGASMGRGVVSPPFFLPGALGPSQAYPAYTGVTNGTSESAQSLAQLVAGGRGRGAYPPGQSYSNESMTAQHAGGMGYTAQPQQYMSSSSDTEDDSQYHDAPSWVGGGYGGDLQPSTSYSNSATSLNSNYQGAAASHSASATSMASNPKVVGSWADEVDKSFPMPYAVPSSDSLSSDRSKAAQ